MKRRFRETVDLRLVLGTDPKRGDHAVRGTAILPHGTGTTVRVAVFADPEDAAAAKEAGIHEHVPLSAHHVIGTFCYNSIVPLLCLGSHCISCQLKCLLSQCNGLQKMLTTVRAMLTGADVIVDEKLIDHIAAKGSGVIDFDKLVATKSVQSQLSKIARILGPRGLMPNAKVGTLTDDVAAAVRSLKAGRIEFRWVPVLMLGAAPMSPYITSKHTKESNFMPRCFT